MSEYLRFCNHCGHPIAGLRLVRGSHFCKDDCRRQDSNARRRLLAERKCRLCGTRLRTKGMKLAPVRDAHEVTPERRSEVFHA